jgi:hypothetical protein
MVSDRKRQANQRNARNSTGPKTDEGKARSRGNAWKHGLAGAGVVENDDDRARLQERVELWTEDMKPRNAVEAWLIERAAKASVRLDRCGEKEGVEVAYKRFEAVERWEKSARESVTQTAAKLSQAPAETVRTLEETTLGCDWLLTRWEILVTSFAARGMFTEAEFTLAANLLGEVVDKTVALSERAAALCVNAFAARAKRNPDEVDGFLGVSTKHLDPEERQKATEASLPDRLTAQIAIRETIVAEDERLEAMRELALSRDQAELAYTADRASFDAHHIAQLMQRYETAHSLDLHRCLSQLSKMRKLESASEGPAEAQIQPEAQPNLEPAAAPSEPLRNEATTAATTNQKTVSVNGSIPVNGSNGHSDTRKERSSRRSRQRREVAETSAGVPALA